MCPARRLPEPALFYELQAGLHGLGRSRAPGAAERQFTEAELRAAHFAAMQNEADSEEGNIEMRAEGKEYIVQDGDVLLFRFNV